MLSTSVFADGALKQITAYLTPDVSVELDGQKVALQNAPVNYDGSTYLPVRELAGAVGLSVEWDPNSRTAKLNSGKSPAIAEPGSTTEAEVSDNPRIIAYPDHGERVSAPVIVSGITTVKINDATYYRIFDFWKDFEKLGYSLILTNTEDLNNPIAKVNKSDVEIMSIPYKTIETYGYISEKDFNDMKKRLN